MNFSSFGHTCVIGLHWGDEGKGKIVDLLTEHFDIVVRYNGGGNAGHTVQIDGQKFALHLLPVGVLSPGKTAVIGPGIALDLPRMLEELDALAARGITVGDRLRISDRAHLVMPYHKKQDTLSEAALGNSKIGTTARGIGPCYADKMLRASAIRVGDLFNPEALAEKVNRIVRQKNIIFKALYNNEEPLDAAAILAEYRGYAEKIRPNVCDTTQYLHDAIQAGKKLLFEGANGTLLDIDHGTFPYVTSSATGPVGIPAGAGVPPSTLKTCIGVTKGYTTRVGAGPFPSELKDEIGQYIRDRGHEYGTTTGRPRRCGWFDAVAGRYSVRLGGISQLAVMHLDTLTGLERIGICTGYRTPDGPLPGFISDSALLQKAEPVIEYLPGWKENLREVRTIDQLPRQARDYLDRIESLMGVPVTIVSVGPDRSQTLFRT
ncbi:MAG TPA: adenylosuccinate synthase [Phycisphaerae bacterium]|jgi:adenylosuccinate synthase|nr:adenylosuccinate synthase [Phycisphaerae bacterium]HOB75782.1 adenylosuccinate synthase [Phycisphaerae bacterium]HOJ55586.1 adenylosuccinate synthase [Phycisphaerae bacterium]HOL27718.1 adenylosuccinate synthase [Phycisphaerae bacterium]HPP21900.1 adenylosuccinate synthase [Phycisphaerae bacterium]